MELELLLEAEEDTYVDRVYLLVIGRELAVELRTLDWVDETWVVGMETGLDFATLLEDEE